MLSFVGFGAWEVLKEMAASMPKPPPTEQPRPGFEFGGRGIVFPIGPSTSIVV